MFLNFRLQNGTEWRCLWTQREEDRDVLPTELGGRKTGEGGRGGAWHPQRGRGVGTLRGCWAGAVGQAWEPQGGRQAQRRKPPTRHCLDAAIIVSSEHPGSACAAEKELNKERGRKKKAEQSRSEPACPPAARGSFSAWAPPLCGEGDRSPQLRDAWWGQSRRCSSGALANSSELGFSQRMVGRLGLFHLRGL